MRQAWIVALVQMVAQDSARLINAMDGGGTYALTKAFK